MNEFVELPLKKRMNRRNIYTRLDDLEAKLSAGPSARVRTLDETGQNTGTLVVDNLIVPAPGVLVTEPTSTDFTGSAITGGGTTFGSNIMHIFSVAAGVLQAGWNTAGKFIFGAGAGILDVFGITLVSDEFPPTALFRAITDDDSTKIGEIAGAYGGAAGDQSGWVIDAIAKESGWTSFVYQRLFNSSGVEVGSFILYSGGVEINFTQVASALGAKSLVIKHQTTSTNALDTLLSLLVTSSGSPAAGLGSVMQFLAENSAGEDQQIGYIGAEYTDPTNGSEDSRIAVGRYKAGALESGYFDWGNYTPTLFNTTNVAASSANGCKWARIGNMVIVSGGLDVDPTAAGGATVVGISLPIASNFANTLDCRGTAAANAVVSESGQVEADATNDRAAMSWITTTTVNHNMSFIFMYEIK